MAKVGRFWSDEGEAEYRRVYDDARALWPEHEVRALHPQAVEGLDDAVDDGLEVGDG